MQTWEYRKVIVKTDDLTETTTLPPADSDMAKLRSLGKEGWELVSVLKELELANAKMKIYNHTFTFYLKRPVSN